MLSRSFIFPTIFLFAALASLGGEPAPLPSWTPWNLTALSRVPKVEWGERTGTVRTMLYEGEPYKGRATRVFAYYASPSTLGVPRAAGTKYPAVLILPGSDGFASGQWVLALARLGYAAFTMDLRGSWEPPGKKIFERLPDGGPPADDETRFRQADGPPGDTWMYHGVANAILARSLLTTVPDIDQAHVAVVGSGWGGYLTCLVASIDPRFQAAVPVFACGFLETRSFWSTRHFPMMTQQAREKWTKLWDPANYLASARIPMLFVTGANNPFFPMDSYARTYALVNSAKKISVQPKLKHGLLYDSREILVFLDEQFKGGPPLPKFTSVSTTDRKLRAEVETKAALKFARLYYTTGPHSENATRPWVERMLTVDGSHLAGEAPPHDTTAWFILVQDANDVLASSEMMIGDGG